MRRHNLALAVLLFLLTSLTFAADNSAYVYVGSYINQHGTDPYGYIIGYAVAADGSAQPITGSPFNGPVFNLVAVRNYLYADDGQNIATYNVAPGGVLTQTSLVNDVFVPYTGSIFALNPDRAGQTLNTVIGSGSYDNYILPWSIAADGQLSYIGSPTMPPRSFAKWQGVFTYSPLDDYAYTITWGSFATFQSNSNGTLTWLENDPLPAAPQGQSIQDEVCTVYTTAASVQGYVALVWSGGGYWCSNSGYLLATYTVGADGNLELVPQSGFTPQIPVAAMAFDPTGNYLAFAGNGIEIYKLEANGTLTPIVQFIGSALANNLGPVLWDNANHIYALGGFCTHEGCNNQLLYIFNFDGKNLTLAPGSPYPLHHAVSLAVLPASQRKSD